jgi:hypothetical protein
MSRRLRPIVVCSLLLAVFAPARARAASVYSMVLVGERIESGDIRAIALGGSNQLVTDSLGVLYSNPALSSRVRLVLLGATQLFAIDEGRSEEYTERDNTYLFPALRMAFPIANRFVFSIGYTSRYDPDGSFQTQEVSDSGDPYTVQFTKSGGLFSVPLTLSADITRYASVGLTFSLERGNVEERWDIIFDDPQFVPGFGFQREDLSGTGFGGGLVLRPTSRLLIGGSYESEIDYDSDVVRQFSSAALDTGYTTVAKLPARASVGITWGISRFLFLASYGWSDFSDFSGLGFPADRLGEEKSYAFGIEDVGFKLGGKQIPIRVSFHYQELPFDHPAGQSVSKYLVGLGTGVSVMDGRGKFDIAIQAGKTGSIGENGVEDRLFRLYLGIVGGEAWTRRAGGRP